MNEQDVYKVDHVYFLDEYTATIAFKQMRAIFETTGILTLEEYFRIIGRERLPIHSEYGWDSEDDFPLFELNDLVYGARIHIVAHPKRLVKEEVKTEMVKINGMSHEEFERLLNELDGNSVKTLASKNARYAPGNDALHNFNEGADIDGSTPAQACWGYMTKHLVALRDMVKRNDFHDRDDFMEKCQDVINYVRILWCIGNEERKNYVSNVAEKETE